MIGRVNVVDYFDRQDVDYIEVTTKAVNDLDFSDKKDGANNLEQVVEFGIKDVVTEQPWYSEFNLIPYDDITAAKVMFDDDSFTWITPSGIKVYDGLKFI